METLRSRWESVRGGGSAAIVITGEPGEGKTRLASELAALAHAAGATVLYGRCDADSIVPDQPVAEALRWYVAACEPGLLRDQVADSTVLVSLVPSLTARLPDLASPSTPIAGRAELTSAVVGFITRAAASNPMLLVLDDLQDASPRTLELVAELAHRTAAGPDAARAVAPRRRARRRRGRRTASPLEGLSLDGVATSGPRAPGRAARARRSRRRRDRRDRRQRDRWQPGSRSRGDRPPALRRRAERGSREHSGERSSRRRPRRVRTRVCSRSSPRTRRSSSVATRTSPRS